MLFSGQARLDLAHAIGHVQGGQPLAVGCRFCLNGLGQARGPGKARAEIGLGQDDAKLITAEPPDHIAVAYRHSQSFSHSL